jgi:hypothetical protein
MISPRSTFKGVRRILAALTLGSLCAGVWPSLAAAQGFELVGARPRGMGGAFVAVADDASATWWNPAGLPATLIFDAVADLGALEAVPDRRIEDTSKAGQARAWQVAAAFPVAGLSFTQVHQWRLDAVPTAGPSGSRQEGGRVPTARSLLTQHFGVSLAQSLGGRGGRVD